MNFGWIHPEIHCFTGKELSVETGLYDFSARFMHARFGRFTTLDPLAEKCPGISPYAYCNGNPVNFVDPDGMDWYAYYLGRQDRYENMLPYMSYAWTDAKSQEELDALGIQGTYMGKAVSSGCLLINADEWDAFERQVGPRDFKLILNRR